MDRRFMLTLIIIIASIGVVGMTLQHWERVDREKHAIDRENNAFNKDCNDRGGMAFTWDDGRQCIGARPPAQGGAK